MFHPSSSADVNGRVNEDHELVQTMICITIGLPYQFSQFAAKNNRLASFLLLELEKWKNC